uniref:DUF7138 domain-containing protein n=1 Tax=Oryza barthii TaxID=65489 RepID=A0A0D3FUK0_9ORYZ
MGEPASSPPVAVLPIVFVDGNQTIDLGTITVQPSLGVCKLQAVVGLVPQQILSSLARTRRARHSPLEEGPDLAAAVVHEGSRLLGPRHCPPFPPREEGGGYGCGSGDRARRAGAGEDHPEASPPTDLASLASNPSPEVVMFRVSYYKAQLQEMQRQRAWYLMHTAVADPVLLADARSIIKLCEGRPHMRGMDKAKEA